MSRQLGSLSRRAFSAASESLRSAHVSPRPADDLAVRMAAAFHQLKAFRFFPDVLDEFQPTAELRVVYGRSLVVSNGKVLKPEVTQEAPKVRRSCSHS